MRSWTTLILVVLAGCSTVGEKSGAVAGTSEWFKTASEKDVTNYFRGQCVASGVMVGTAEMAECIQREAAFHKQSGIARSAAVAAATAGGSSASPQ